MLNFKHGGNVIELGGGANPAIHPNVDIIAGPNVDIVADFNKKLPLEDESYDGIFSRYAIEHISWHNVECFIQEIYRILKPGGKAIIITANTYEQCKKIVDEGINKDTVELLFGSQEFPDHGGTHKMGFSPEYAEELFKNADFTLIRTFPHPDTVTDLIIEAYKMKKEEVFERSYFEDGTYGYKNYRDFATHYSTARIIEEMKPESVLSLGCGRAYVVRILENHGIKAIGMDISKHCWHTRATDSFILHDATKTPWVAFADPKISGIADKEFDLSFSINFLEHISEEKLDDVIREIVRVSKRGLHGIHFTESPYEEADKDIDITHVTSKSESWWNNKFKTLAPDYDVVLKHPRLLEYEHPEHQPQPTSIAPPIPDNLVKLNIGSFLDCFYYGWKNIDILDLKSFADNQAYNFLQHDARKDLPFKDNSVDIIASNHFIEHISRSEGRQFFKECHRVLKSGGIMRISTPDTQIITQKYIDGNIWEYRYINTGIEQATDDAEAYFSLLLSGHKTIYDEKSLTKMLEQTDFKEIKKVSPFESRSEAIQTQTLTTHPSISIILEATR